MAKEEEEFLIDDYDYQEQLEQDAAEIVIFSKAIIATFYMYVISGVLILLFLLFKNII
jgi:hypothetical protein